MQNFTKEESSALLYLKLARDLGANNVNFDKSTCEVIINLVERLVKKSNELRLCTDTKNNEKLLFHHWLYGDFAFCEKEDGTMIQIDRSRVKFFDNKYNEYYFIDHPTEKGGN